jgi:hypothetical protein
LLERKYDEKEYQKTVRRWRKAITRTRNGGRREKRCKGEQVYE